MNKSQLETFIATDTYNLLRLEESKIGYAIKKAFCKVKAFIRGGAKK